MKVPPGIADDPLTHPSSTDEKNAFGKSSLNAHRFHLYYRLANGNSP